MVQEGFKRKLTAILSADAVAYSRLMGIELEHLSPAPCALLARPSCRGEVSMKTEVTPQRDDGWCHKPCLPCEA